MISDHREREEAAHDLIRYSTLIKVPASSSHSHVCTPLCSFVIRASCIRSREGTGEAPAQSSKGWLCIRLVHTFPGRCLRASSRIISCARHCRKNLGASSDSRLLRYGLPREPFEYLELRTTRFPPPSRGMTNELFGACVMRVALVGRQFSEILRELLHEKEPRPRRFARERPRDFAISGQRLGSRIRNRKYFITIFLTWDYSFFLPIRITVGILISFTFITL